MSPFKLLDQDCRVHLQALNSVHIKGRLTRAPTGPTGPRGPRCPAEPWLKRKGKKLDTLNWLLMVRNQIFAQIPGAPITADSTSRFPPIQPKIIHPPFPQNGNFFLILWQKLVEIYPDSTVTIKTIVWGCRDNVANRFRSSQKNLFPCLNLLIQRKE